MNLATWPIGQTQTRSSRFSGSENKAGHAQIRLLVNSQSNSEAKLRKPDATPTTPAMHSNYPR